MGAEDLHPGLSRASVQALSRAMGAVQQAQLRTRTWRHGTPIEYAAAGPDAVTCVNQAMSHLEHARGALLAEMELLPAPPDDLPPQPVPDVTGHPSGTGGTSDAPGDTDE